MTNPLRRIRSIVLPTRLNRAQWSVLPITYDADQDAAYEKARDVLGVKLISEMESPTQLIHPTRVARHTTYGVSVFPQVTRQNIGDPVAFAASCLAVVDAYGASMINIVQEWNGDAAWYATDGNGAKLYLVRQILKTAHPNLIVMASMNYEAALNANNLSNSVGVMGFMDAIGVTTYPQLQGLNTATDMRSAVGSEYYNPLLRACESTNRPIVFCELGWHTRFTGGREQQAAFLTTIGEIVRQNKVLAAAWYFIDDADLIPWPIEYFWDMGLADETGVAKSSLSVFRGLVANG